MSLKYTSIQNRYSSFVIHYETLISSGYKPQVMSRQLSLFKSWHIFRCFLNPKKAMLEDVDKWKIRQTMNESQHKWREECAN